MNHDGDLGKKDASEAHRERTARRKALVERRMSEAQRDAGVLIVATGNGKGKSTSGFGMVARALGHGIRVGVVQFIKGAISSGEARFFGLFPEDVEFRVAGEGYTWETQDRERDVRKAEEGWAHGRRMLADPAFGLVLLDELNIVLDYGYLDLERVLAALRARPPMQHVMVTGRSAPPALLAAADTVTEMTLVKHAFDHGVRAQKGVEW